MKHLLPELKYSYESLEPHIDALTMEIHYSRHHAAYINNLNSALEKYSELQEKGIEELLAGLDEIPEPIRQVVRNNGGGHYNHSLFWSIIGPNGGGEAKGELRKTIDRDFGSFEKLKEEFSKAAATRFGSGWAWVVLNKEGNLQVISTPNQDSPISEGLKPLMGLDVWEHAYYLKYQNKRPDYINAWWNIVNWDVVEARYESMK